MIVGDTSLIATRLASAVRQHQRACHDVYLLFLGEVGSSQGNNGEEDKATHDDGSLQGNLRVGDMGRERDEKTHHRTLAFTWARTSGGGHTAWQQSVCRAWCGTGPLVWMQAARWEHGMPLPFCWCCFKWMREPPAPAQNFEALDESYRFNLIVQSYN